MATEQDVEDNTRNIYILAGVFGGTCFLLLILVAVLFTSVHRLNSKVGKIQQDLANWGKGPQQTQAQIFPRATPSRPNSMYGGTMAPRYA